MDQMKLVSTLNVLFQSAVDDSQIGSELKTLANMVGKPALTTALNALGQSRWAAKLDTGCGCNGSGDPGSGMPAIPFIDQCGQLGGQSIPLPDRPPPEANQCSNPDEPCASVPGQPGIRPLNIKLVAAASATTTFKLAMNQDCYLIGLEFFYDEIWVPKDITVLNWARSTSLELYDRVGDNSSLNMKANPNTFEMPSQVFVNKTSNGTNDYSPIIRTRTDAPGNNYIPPLISSWNLGNSQYIQFDLKKSTAADANIPARFWLEYRPRPKVG